MLLILLYQRVEFLGLDALYGFYVEVLKSHRRFFGLCDLFGDSPEKSLVKAISSSLQGFA